MNIPSQGNYSSAKMHLFLSDVLFEISKILGKECSGSQNANLQKCTFFLDVFLKMGKILGTECLGSQSGCSVPRTLLISKKSFFLDAEKIGFVSNGCIIN